MRRIAGVVVVLSLFCFVSALGQTGGPESAKSILNAAVQKAGASGKSVMVIFHASWCGWCKRLDAMLQSSEIKPLFERSYIVVHLDVLENGGKLKTLENPGGRESMTELGGERAGLPFYAFLDGAGKKLADSNVMPKNQNIGYPGSAEEIEAFESLLKKTATRMSDDQRQKVVAYLQKNAPR